MVQGYPYQAGYAKSGRATCIGCDSLIEDGKLRIAQNCDVGILYRIFICV